MKENASPRNDTKLYLKKKLADALSYLKKGKNDEAEKIYSKLISEGYLDSKIIGNLAALKGMRGLHAEAIKLLKQAVKIENKNPDSHYNLGLAYMQLKKWDDAIDSFTNATKISPTHQFAHNNMGIIHKERGDQASAFKAFQTAIDIDPKNHEAYNNIAILHKSNGDVENAYINFRKAIESNQNFAEAHNNMGLLLKDMGNSEGAIASLSIAVSIQPLYSEAHNNLGTAYKESGKLNQAIESFKRSIEVNSNNPSALNNIGNAYQEKKEYDKAIDYHKKALSICKDKPKSEYSIALANALTKKGDTEDAILAYRKVINAFPNSAEARINIGSALKEQNNVNEAIIYLEESIAINDKIPEAYSLIGLCYLDASKPNDAIKMFKKASTLKPDSEDNYYNIGLAYGLMSEKEKMRKYFMEALSINPSFHAARWNLALTQLSMGDYETGWKNYESRFEKENKKEVRIHSWPKCNRLRKTYINQVDRVPLTVVSEQGLGDTIQFMRYIHKLKDIGYDVTFSAQEKLHGLIKKSGIDLNPITPQEANEISRGTWIPLLSLPYLLDVSEDNPIWTDPYIHTDETLTDKWNSKIKASNTKGLPIIGLHWQGNPITETTNLKGRSFELETFKPIADLKLFKLISLQKGHGSEQLLNCSFKEEFVNCQDKISDTYDFLETAAIVNNCNLVITNDSAIAHISGGLGKATWLLLHNNCDWRWGLNKETTFWYRSARIFRQSVKGEWDAVVGNIIDCLRDDPMLEKIKEIESSKNQNKKPLKTPYVPTSIGELIDKISILEIKMEKLADTKNVDKELRALNNSLTNLNINIKTKLISSLRTVNRELWKIEDDIRECERLKEFNENFIRLARSVYVKNDERASIKREINFTYSSGIIEEKSYKEFY